jgi:hypothetical protein
MPQRKLFIFKTLMELLPAGKWAWKEEIVTGINCSFSKMGAQVNPSYIR